MRDQRNWSDAPSADVIAWAIVAAARECGADPMEIASGGISRGTGEHARSLTRARAYAAKALAKLFTSYPRTRIAGFVGCRGLVRQSYFSALDQRIRNPATGQEWWDEAVLDRVMQSIPVSELRKAAAPKRQVADLIGGYLADDSPIFDRSGSALAGVKMREPDRKRSMSKAEMEADLREAVRRTAMSQKSED